MKYLNLLTVILIVVKMLKKIASLFKRDKKEDVNQFKKPKIIGVCLGWDLEPHLYFSDGTYLYGNAEKILYPEYFIDGQDWPVAPITKEKLPIVETGGD